MKTIITLLLVMASATGYAQPKKVELYDLVKKLAADSLGYESAGDWAMGQSASIPVQWELNRIIMSDDEKINFYRKGKAAVTVMGKTYSAAGKPVTWDVMLMGPRMGHTSFRIQSGTYPGIGPKPGPDSLFGKKAYSYKMLQECIKPNHGFYYYELKMPKKNTCWVKQSWQCTSGACNIRLEVYDAWSKQYTELGCK